MSSKKLKQLQRIERLIALHQQQDLQRLGEANKAHQQALAKLEGIKRYQVDYAQELQDKGKQVVSSMLYNSHYLFLVELQHLRAKQVKNCEQTESLIDQAKQAWLQTHNKAGALTKAIAKEEALEQQREAKQEQLVSESFCLNWRLNNNSQS